MGIAARGSVGMLVVGVDIAPALVAQVIGENSGLSRFGVCWPEDGEGVSPGVACRGGAEPDARDD